MFGAASAIHSAVTDHGELMTLVAVKQRSLLTAGDEDEEARSLSVMPKTTEQHLIVCSDKSEAEVTNNKR